MMNKSLKILLESMLDDYYFLWECFSEYSQVTPHEDDKLKPFIELVLEAYRLKYFDFYKGQNFDGEEVLVENFNLNESMIKSLLNWTKIPEVEIRVKTSEMGYEFLQHNYN